MANIAIINYCNLNCPYCFANTFIKEEEKQLISIEQLNKILNFLSKGPIDRIGIIGGEPTIHPQFKDILLTILDFCKNYNTKKTPLPLLFTNGIELNKYVKYLYHIGVLINLNEPKIIGENNYEKIKASLKKINQLDLMEHVTLGINLYPEIQDIDHIFKLTQQYNLDKIRCSYTAPACQFANFVNKEEYYNNGKNLFLNFIEKAAQNNVKIIMDCNKIPLCYFDDKEQEFILEHCENYSSYCSPVIDIMPNFKAASCFGTYNTVDLNMFDNLQQVSNYMNIMFMDQKRLKNHTGKCKDCPKAKNLSCQGGCLSFVKS